MARTSDELVNAVQISCMVPTNQADITPDRILGFANEEIEGKILPTIKAVNQEYLVSSITTPLVSGVQNYSIPYRYMGRTAREVKLFDGTMTRNLALIKLEDAHFYNYASVPNGFYFQGDQIYMVPKPISSSMSLQWWGLQRPGRLTAVANCGVVTSIGASTVTLASVPSTFLTGGLVDMIQGQSGNSLWAQDVAITGIAGNTLSFAVGTVPTSLVVGDYICPPWQSCVLQYPEEAFGLTVCLASIRVFKAIGDLEAAQAEEQLVSDKIRQFQMMIEPRIEGINEKIIQRVSLLRGNRSRFRRGLIYP